MDASPNMMNTSRTLGPQAMSTMSSAMSPAKSPAKTQISLTMLSGYILAGLVLIGLIVMVVLYMKKPCSPGNDCTKCPGQPDCSQCGGTNVTCGTENGSCKTDCSSTCNTTGTGLSWKDDQCTVSSDWTGLVCPEKCKLTSLTEKPKVDDTWPWDKLCPYGYYGAGVRDPRITTGATCTRGADTGYPDREDLVSNCKSMGGVNPTCKTNTKVNPYKCCEKSDKGCQTQSNDDDCFVIN